MSTRQRVVVIAVGCGALVAALGGAAHLAERNSAEEGRVKAVTLCEDAFTTKVAARNALDVVYAQARDALASTDGLALAAHEHAALAATADLVGDLETTVRACASDASRDGADSATRVIAGVREQIDEVFDRLGREVAALTLVSDVHTAFHAAGDDLSARVADAEALLATSQGRVVDDAVRADLAATVTAARAALEQDVEATVAAHRDAGGVKQGLISGLAERKEAVQAAQVAWEAEQARLEAERIEAERVAAERRRQDVIASAGLTEARVTRVIDGDTIEVEIAGSIERVRLIGIDAPEIGAAGADSATAFTRAAIDDAGGVVWLERSGSNRDRFDRLRRNVWLDVPTSTGSAQQRSALLLNRRLLDAGHAVVPAAPRPAPAPAPRPAPRESAPAARAPFRNCTEVWDTLGRPIRRGEPGFHPRLDRDNDGVGCEWNPRR